MEIFYCPNFELCPYLDKETGECTMAEEENCNPVEVCEIAYWFSLLDD